MFATIASRIRGKNRWATYRKRLGNVIRGGTLLEDMSSAERRALFPMAPELSERHIKNCRIIRNRDVLLNLLPRGSICAEIGVDEGLYSEKILRTTEPQILELIDISPQSQKICQEKFAAEITTGRVRFHLGDSAALLSTFPNRTFDWLYIDGDHRYPGVKRDLEVSRQKIKPDGLILMNDYAFFGISDFGKYGVIEAANEFCLAHDFEIIYLALQGRGYYDVVLRKIL